MSRILLPSILTAWNPHWLEEIQSIEILGLSKIALFLTGLDAVQRQRCYQELRKIPGLIVPFIHARHDMDASEFKYLCKEFGTKKFNLHSQGEYKFQHDLSPMKKMIYLENSGSLEEEDLAGYGGICLDLSHLEDWRLSSDDRYQVVDALIKKYGVGVNHISAILTVNKVDKSEELSYACHVHNMSNIAEFDYLKRYPAGYFGEYIALELLNPLSEQLELIVYLDEILKDKGVSSQV